MIWPTMGTTESTSLWEVGVRGVEKPLRAVSGLAWAEIGLPTRCATCCATRCSLCCARCTCCKWPKLSLHHSLLRNHSLDETLDKLTSVFAPDNVSAKTSNAGSPNHTPLWLRTRAERAAAGSRHPNHTPIVDFQCLQTTHHSFSTASNPTPNISVQGRAVGVC